MTLMFYVLIAGSPRERRSELPDPHRTPMEQLWTNLLDFIDKLVSPDWGALIALLPVALLAARRA